MTRSFFARELLVKDPEEASKVLQSMIRDQMRVARAGKIGMEYTDRMTPHEFELLAKSISQELREERNQMESSHGAGGGFLSPDALGWARIG